jgi:hypothetical protein
MPVQDRSLCDHYTTPTTSIPEKGLCAIAPLVPPLELSLRLACCNDTRSTVHDKKNLELGYVVRSFGMLIRAAPEIEMG